MTSVNQITWSQNFIDVLSPTLLTQPEPQYPYAKMALSALGTALPVPPDIGLPGRELNAKGAPYAQLDDMQLMLSDPIGKELFAVGINLLGATGMQVRINRPKFTDSTYTEASRRLTPGVSVSTSGIALSSEQSLITLHEYAGPYSNSANAVVPIAIDKGAAQNGVHNAWEAAGLQFTRDFHKWLDHWIVSTLDLTTNIVRPRGMTADTDATGAGQFPLDYETMMRTNRIMNDASLPRLPDGRRIFVVTPTGALQLSLDRRFQRASAYMPEFNTLFAGTYIKSLPEFHIFMSQTLTVADNASGVEIQHAQAIAPGALGFVMGMPPEIAPNTNDDYGRTILAIWKAWLGLELLDERFVYSVRYTEDG